MGAYCSREFHRDLLADPARLQVEATYLKTIDDRGGRWVDIWKCNACGKALARGRGPHGGGGGGRGGPADTPTAALTAVEICAHCRIPARDCPCGW